MVQQGCFRLKMPKKITKQQKTNPLEAINDKHESAGAILV